MKWNFLALVLKNFRKRKPRKKCLIFEETETLKKILIFREMELFSPPRENFLYFRKRNPGKKIQEQISRYRTSLYFEKGIFRTLAYLEPEAYSEPWYIQNPGIFKTRSIFRTLVYLEPETY